MKTVEFNINKNVLVKFTDLGFMELARQQNEALKDWTSFEEVNAGTFLSKCNAKGYFKMRMWELFQFFQNLDGNFNVYKTPNLMALNILLITKED